MATTSIMTYSLDTPGLGMYKRATEGRSVISHLLLRGKLGNDPTLRDALLLEPSMLTLSWRTHTGTSRSPSTSVLADHARPPRLRWMNFSICPHCLANGRPGTLERLNEWGPIISRSDGVNFHLVLGGRPVAYPEERAAGKTEMISAGFWYLHEANGGSTETAVVILRRPPTGGVSLLRHLEMVADKLFDKLCKSGHLSCLYDFDGERLTENHCDW
jgi:hypothetical protein